MHALREINLTTVDTPEQFLLSLALERLNTEQNSVQYNACRPIVGSWTRVLLIVTEFWGHEGGRAAERSQFLIRILGLRCKAIVNYLGRLGSAPVVYQNVLELDVTVRYVSIMIVVHCMHDLVEYLSAVSLRQAFARQTPWSVRLLLANDHV